MSEYRHLCAQCERYILRLEELERARLTIEKYQRDIRGFLAFFRTAEHRDKRAVIAFKAELERDHAVSSVNSTLSAVNGFLRFAGREDWRVRPIRTQRRLFCPQERELSKPEYERLLTAARRRRDQRLYMLLQTLCSTGIRVSELSAVTVAAVRLGRAEIRCKGKCRVILLPRKLCRLLLGYAARRGLAKGQIFVTRTGRPLDRSNVWAEMKGLCQAAGVASSKVFPHNLRHLFARTYYARERDLARLADLLGHSNVNTTRIYVVSSGLEHKRQIENMGLIFS